MLAKPFVSPFWNVIVPPVAVPEKSDAARETDMDVGLSTLLTLKFVLYAELDEPVIHNRVTLGITTEMLCGAVKVMTLFDIEAMVAGYPSNP